MSDLDTVIAALEAGEPIGWQVVDADGNVVDSGPISYAEMTSELAEQVGLPDSTTAQEG